MDIMRPEEAAAFPPDDIALPPTQIFEVRVVIWKCKDVPPMDTFEGMSDLFVKCWPEGCAPQETDTHWRAKKGKASFNWRLLFDVELGQSTRAMKFPYLHLQLWDRDIVKWNDCAGEGAIDLGRFYRKAYKRNVAIKLFETKKGGVAKRAQKREKLSHQVRDTEDDIPSSEDEDDDVMNPLSPAVQEQKQADIMDSGRSDDVIGRGSLRSSSLPSQSQRLSSSSDADRDRGFIVGPSVSRHNTNRLMVPPRNEPDSDDDDYAAAAADGVDSDDDDDYGNDMLDDGISYNNKPQQRKKRILIKPPSYSQIKKKKKKSKKTKKQASSSVETSSSSSWINRLMFWKKKEPVYLLDDDGKFVLDEQGNKIIATEDKNDAAGDEEEEKSDENDEMRGLVNSFKNMTGMWDIDPEDSDWYHLVSKDKNDPNSKEVAMGSICFSVQIWPKDKAIVMKSGPGRSEPNTNPFCPPPVGRLQFSWNPFVMGAELCGPKICFYVMVVILCAVFITLMFVCQPFLNIVINLIFVIY